MNLPDDFAARLALLSSDAMAAQIEASIASGTAHANRMAAEHRDRITPIADIATMTDGTGGFMHAASLRAWLALAERAGVPHVEADLVATLDIEDVYAYLDGVLEPTSPAAAEFAKASAHAAQGGYWRTDLCASSEVKWQLSETGSFEPSPHFGLDDPRIMDMHCGMPEILILGRPLLTPVRINGWPVEFRVFVGGRIQDSSAVSFYYPQAPEFEVTPELVAAAEQSREWALRIHALRDQLGIVPRLPDGPEGPEIGATIDFMLTEERGLVLIDAGPGFGYGAHPCAFIDSPITGVRWRLADGVVPR